MRILVVNPYGCTPGYSGPRVLAERLFGSLADQQHDLTLLTVRAPGAVSVHQDWADRTVRLGRLSALGRREQLCWTLAATGWLLLHARKHDVIHVHGCYLFNLLPMLAALVHRTPYVLFPLTEEGDLHRLPRSSGGLSVLAAVQRFLVRGAARGFALSESIGSELVANSLPPARVVAVGNGVDVTAFSPPQPTSDQRESLLTLGFVGKLGTRKRADLVLAALDVLHGRGCPARAVFVGPFESDAYRSGFEAQVHRLGLHEFVHVTGYVDEVAPYLREQMSVFVLLSSNEGLPAALVEAMACGLPCAVTDVGAMAAVVRAAGAGAVLQPSGTELADFALQLWADPDTWRTCSSNARAFASEHFAVTHVAQTYLDGLAELDQVLVTAELLPQ